MNGRNKGKPKSGFGFFMGLLSLVLILGLVGELNPATAMELQGGATPVANDDSFGFRIGVGTTVAAPGVLANDTDDDEVISAIPTGPDGEFTADGGTYILYANGSFTYTPPAIPLDTTDTFTYRVVDSTDPQNTSDFAATVTLVGSNYDIMDDRYGFRTGVFRYVYPEIGVLSNDGTIVEVLPDGTKIVEPLPDGTEAHIFSGPTYGSLIPPATCLPPAGSCPTTGLMPDGSFTYYPSTSDWQTDQFQYIVKDSLGNQIGGPATVLLTNSVTCSVDVDGPNDEPGQGDLTQFCRDTFYETMSDELAMSVNWDDVDLGGTNSADSCALFDTDGDRGVNNALCMSWQANGAPTPGYPKFYGCDDRVDKPKQCTGYYEIPQNATSRFSCRLVDTNDDPFDPLGDMYPYDTKAICYIPYEGNLPPDPTRITLLDVCAYPSKIPNSDYKDCVLGEGIPTLLVLKDVVGVETYQSTEWIIGIDPLPERPVINLEPADNHLFGDDETPTYALTVGLDYTITESEGTLNPYPYLELSSQNYYCRNYGGETVMYYPPTADPADDTTWPSAVDGISLPTAALNDKWECTFRNTYSNVTKVDLYNFRATVRPNDILLEWETVSEYNNLGFNLFRATSAAGANYVQLNAELIPPIEPGGMQGGEYSYVDSYNLDPTATYYYWLQDVDLNGTLTLHGPVSTNQPKPLVLPIKIYLPSIVGGN